MATTPRSEYLGFTVNDTCRVYRMRVKELRGEARTYSLTIANRAFVEQRVSYQDGPLICFLRLERELLEAGDSVPASNLRITEQDLAEYRDANTKKTSPFRPHKPVKP